ncbi:MAG: HEAT repeat domain-containing protein [Chloroflexota bacterium]|nr:HEAT repeat domain-containing protein [Chloroflexota bacterium]
MPVPRSFKTDESFLEKIAMGATGTRFTFEDLRRHGHDPMELERGSMSFKIWKAIKIKRVRVPDILCLRCGRRVESRAKTKLTITMSHSLSAQERGWDFGLDDDDQVALVPCERVAAGPLDWAAGPLVQYIRVEPLRRTFAAGKTMMKRPKGAQEGFEIQITWPAAVASAGGVVERVEVDSIRYRRSSDGRSTVARLRRREEWLTPLVAPGDEVVPNQIIASMVPVVSDWRCAGGADVASYIRLCRSTSISDRYTAVKALGRFSQNGATTALLDRVEDANEHVYVRVDGAAGLMRRGHGAGAAFLRSLLHDAYLENRLEGAIVLGEVGTQEATELLITTLEDVAQHPEIRAGAAWSLGELGTQSALPVLIKSFNALDMVIKIEAARALAKLAREHLDSVLDALPTGTEAERPGIAWALSKAGGFTIRELLPALTDDDARRWVAYMIGTQERGAMAREIEVLAAHDPEVYFAVTVLWKIIASWIYDLNEY